MLCYDHLNLMCMHLCESFQETHSAALHLVAVEKELRIRQIEYKINKKISYFDGDFLINPQQCNTEWPLTSCDKRTSKTKKISPFTSSWVLCPWSVGMLFSFCFCFTFLRFSKVFYFFFFIIWILNRFYIRINTHKPSDTIRAFHNSLSSTIPSFSTGKQ